MSIKQHRNLKSSKPSKRSNSELSKSFTDHDKSAHKTGSELKRLLSKEKQILSVDV